MLQKGRCNYGDKCLFAHSLEEQYIEPYRKQIYDILNSSNSLEELDLKKDYNIYKTLLELTTICDSCIKKECKGGYNCKHGACKYEYQICINDLNYGNCSNKDCVKLHLTKRGLKPYYGIHENNKYLDGVLLTQSYFNSDNEEDINMENADIEIENNSDIISLYSNESDNHDIDINIDSDSDNENDKSKYIMNIKPIIETKENKYIDECYISIFA